MGAPSAAVVAVVVPVVEFVKPVANATGTIDALLEDDRAVVEFFEPSRPICPTTRSTNASMVELLPIICVFMSRTSDNHAGAKSTELLRSRANFEPEASTLAVKPMSETLGP